MVIKYLLKFFVILFFFVSHNHSRADFFQDITSQIEDNDFRLSYGISVTDVNQDNKYEFVVTGFGFSNLALTYQNEKLVNINKNEIFDDAERKSIGVAACDIDQDGFEEIYFLNTDTYSGEKQYSDRLIDNSSNGFVDLFEKDINKKNLNLTAGRSVVCVDRNGDGKYGIYVANYGGPTRFYEIKTNLPFFCNRDGIKVYSLNEVKLERRTGYSWYSSSPQKLLDQDYHNWKRNINR